MTMTDDTLRALMEKRVAAAQAAARTTPGTTIPARRDPHAPQPLSAAQRRLWFNSQFEHDPAIYHVPLVLRLSGPLDGDALLGALRAVVQRHEVLRSVIAHHGDEPMAVAGPADRVSLTRAEVTAAELDAAIAAEVARPFRLDAEPPLRALLLRLSEQEHVLALTAHHIATDAWSQDLIMDELAAGYAAARGQGAPPAPVRLQYADVTEWAQDRPGGDAGWWAERLAGLDPVLALPTDRPYPPVADWRAGYVPLTLPPELARRVREVAREAGATPFMVLLAAWQALLGRLCRTADVPVGVPESGRRHRDTEGVVGCFINTLVLRTDLSGDPTGRELLARVRETTLDAFAHADVPFEHVVEAVAPQRSTATTPLFQSMLLLLDEPLRDPVLPGVTVTRLDSPLDTNKFDLCLSLTGHADGYNGFVSHRADLLDRATVARWARWFTRLLDGLVATPDRRVSELDLLDPAERAELVSWGTGPELPAGAPATVLEAVLAQAAARPDAVAVDARDGKLSYGELARDSAAVAAALLAHGVERGAPVGLCLPRHRHLPAALVGVMRAGAAYLPLEPDQPVARLRHQLTDAGAGVLVAAADTWDLARELAEGTGAVLLDLADALSAEPAALPEVGADDLVYVLYTSGSTGRPKGVELTHGNLAAYVAANCELLPVTPDDVMLGLTALSFDVAGLELWVALTRGLRLALVERCDAVDGHLVARRIAEAGVTVLTATPTTFRMLVAADWRAPDVRLVAIGEAVDPGLARELLARTGEVWNGYGPTETAVTSTMYRVTAPVGPTVPIGTPMAGERVYVMDAAGRLALPGTVGELWIGGAGVARGYRGRPDLTGAAFTADPLRPDERCYRTGDLVRWRADGLLDFVGRDDGQVKVRGHRIELGEIEVQLRAVPGVAQAAVTVAAAGGDAHLVGYLVAGPGAAVSTAELETRLHAVLPDHMVPRRWALLDALPINASGKLDRRALPEPQRAVREHVPPRTEAEELVADVWAAVLRRDGLSVHDDFFALGGHSLAATLVAGRLREALDLPVPVRLLFEQPVLAGFAAALEALLLAEVVR
ncbi:non-ribosomal peptide synthetase [Catellatospora sp. IY07-71]|uniref:non-ribosomal peptide synthetase n=1 Tax=Catellatospora sp. IY07-71 TaxID=2728827 RepID=UPI001BB329DB|nr:non-ribosomal peptide synthetase [Catellatospora sp. IY07-71]